MYEGFVDLYRHQKVSFDETYFDVCVALTGLAARGPRAAEVVETLELIESAIGGSISLIGPRFYTPTDLIEAKLSWLRPRVLVRSLKISHRLGEHAPLGRLRDEPLDRSSAGAAPRR
jgi:hypothetical protein